LKIAYLDCSSGVSGDMLLGALVDGGVDIKFLRSELQGLRIPFELKKDIVFKNQIRATKVDVIDKSNLAHHTHRHLSDIKKIINSSSLSDNIKKKSLDIFEIVAEAESKVHGVPLGEIHFHEVGAVDSIVDIVGSVIGFEMLKAEKMYVSPLNVGKGYVKTAHGVLSIPAPATSIILQNIPIYSDGTEGELVTPTGAAIVKVMADSFINMPKIKIKWVSFGAGDMNLAIPNLLRIFFGESFNK